MRWWLVVYLAAPLALLAEWDHLFSEEDPLLFQHVNVITGNLNIYREDTVVEGARPLHLFRTYSSVGALEREDKELFTPIKKACEGWFVKEGWSLLPHTRLFYQSDMLQPENAPPNVVHIPDVSGTFIAYVATDDACTSYKPQGSYYQASGTLSARTNPYNNHLTINWQCGEAVLFLPDGGVRHYREVIGYARRKKRILKEGKWTHSFMLVKEILPSKEEVHYHYNGSNLSGIHFKSPGGRRTYSHVWFSCHDAQHLQCNTSDQKELHWKFRHWGGRDYLDHVQTNCHPEEVADYVPGRKEIGARMAWLAPACRERLRVHYNIGTKEERRTWKSQGKRADDLVDKVASLVAPVGANGEKHEVARFEYRKSETDVLHGDGLLTRYFHRDRHLNVIDYRDRDNHVYSKQYFYWKGTRLHCKSKTDGDNRPLFAKTFTYDEGGNVLEETLWGDLSGHAAPLGMDGQGNPSGGESLRKSYTYLTHFNVPLTEHEEGGLTYRYSYKPDSALLAAKLTCDGDKILRREFYLYDSDHLLVCEMSDNGTTPHLGDLEGVTQRLIKRYERAGDSGLVKATVESYWDPASRSEKQLRRTEHVYSPAQKVIQIAIYDANGKDAYTLYTDYDAHGQLVRKTTPRGFEATYRYDEADQLIESKEPGSPRQSMSYDAMGRQTSVTLPGKTTHTTYDWEGHPLTQTDYRGNSLRHAYDKLGNRIKTTLPEVRDHEGRLYAHETHMTPDIHGNVAQQTTSGGTTTHTRYNTYRKPVQITHPDGTETFHLYNKNGTLAKSIQPDKSEVHFAYDSFQRVLSKRLYDRDAIVLSSESWTYDAFNLLSYTDARGLVTHYAYDGAGRKIREEAGGRTTIYSYDALGFLEKRSNAIEAQIQLHDVEGNVIEQWRESTDGTREDQMRFDYDAEGRKVRAVRMTSVGEAVDTFAYDEEGRLRRHVDPYGAVTEFLYDEIKNDLGQIVSRKTTIDPLGNATIETQDAVSRLVLLEKRDAQGKTTFKEETFYDRSGNRAKRLSYVYLEGRETRTIPLRWEHDAMGRITAEVEAESKTTRYAYDEAGNLIRKTLPSGVEISSTYDPLHRLLTQESSDGTVSYAYAYDKRMEPIEIRDRVHQTTLHRRYNALGQVVEELSSSGMKYSWSYDLWGRCTAYTLPDGSSIGYTFHGPHLREVQRKTPDGRVLYRHAYTAFDVNGHVQQERLIGSLGSLETAHDLLERPTHQSSPWLNQSIAYGPSGLVTSIQSSLGSQTYAYDGLNQLAKEGEQQYHFDSLGNSGDCELNACNQIVCAPGCRFVYDPNGNPVERCTQEGTTHYRYDALGRLIEITSLQKHVLYFYDPLSRLLAKETQSSKTFYLYDQMREIGSIDEQGRILDLKLLGLGVKGEIGAAVALELHGTLYAPLHDFKGNLIALVSMDGALAESYHLDAFGRETSPTPPLSPWRFSSKRTLEGLVYFGARFYDPTLGRWLTPDPAGFADGTNLYLFALNSPLNRLDLFGLISASFHELHHLSPTEVEPGQIFADAKLWQTGVHELFPEGVLVDYFTSYGSRFQPNLIATEWSPDNIYLNLMAQKDSFPQNERTIGLVLVSNGIQVTNAEHIRMCESILHETPRTPFISAHNPTTGSKYLDLKRANRAMHGGETHSAIIDRETLLRALIVMEYLGPMAMVQYNAHSEGSALGKNALASLSPDQRALAQQHLIVRTFGGAAPIPKDYGFDVKNAYYDDDIVFTLGTGSSCKNNENYNIDIYKPQESTPSNGWLIGHHRWEAYLEVYKAQLRFETEMKVYKYYEVNR